MMAYSQTASMLSNAIIGTIVTDTTCNLVLSDFIWIVFIHNIFFNRINIILKTVSNNRSNLSVSLSVVTNSVPLCIYCVALVYVISTFIYSFAMRLVIASGIFWGKPVIIDAF